MELNYSQEKALERLLTKLNETWFDPMESSGKTVNDLVEIIGSEFSIAYYQGLGLKLYFSNAGKLKSVQLLELIKGYVDLDKRHFAYKQIYARQ